MSQTAYRTAPLATDQMPPGIPYIVGNEAAERFSYYGMRAILVVFMTKYLLDSSGQLAVMSKPDAMVYYHQFLSAVYVFPLLGALLADTLLGKYRTIIYLSLVYCLGHGALALDETRLGLFVGLTLIAIGSGGIKPCVSAHVGDQFGSANRHLQEKVFSWFYFAINFGSVFSTLLTPWLLEQPGLGARVAFAVPGILMCASTWIFWLGRHKYAHIPPGGKKFVVELSSAEGLKALGKLTIVFAFVAVFWALYDQTSSSWIFQAEKMDRKLSLSFLDWSIEPTAAQFHAINPALILIYIPLFSYLIYPALGKLFKLTPLRKVTIGFFLTALSFVVCAMAEERIQAGYAPHVTWQVVAYMIITAGEVMVSITCLEFAYTQAPRQMKAVVMALYNLSVSMGNQLTALVNALLRNADGTPKLQGSSYFWFFTGLMAATAVAFMFVARWYPEKTYLQEEGKE